MSRAIDDLRHEHDAILSALGILDAMVGKLGGRKPPTGEDLQGFLGFLKEFADKCHHGKEEGILFPALVAAGIPEQGGPGRPDAGGARGGPEAHQSHGGCLQPRGRPGFRRSGRRLCRLLRSHIAKENDVLFPAADRVL